MLLVLVGVPVATNAPGGSDHTYDVELSPGTDTVYDIVFCGEHITVVPGKIVPMEFAYATAVYEPLDDNDEHPGLLAVTLMG